MNPKQLDTYVYIDVSNIRESCNRSCHFTIDFLKFIKYLKKKYPKLKEVRYYEGIARDDRKKKEDFRKLRKAGYKVCELLRKSYIAPPQYAYYECKNCGKQNKIKRLSSIVKMKSNVDVYLATDMMYQAAKQRKPMHILLVACDGDYVEAIKNILRINPYVFVTILGTPYTGNKTNSLSKRLKIFGSNKYNRATLANIEPIKDLISKNNKS